MAIIEPFGLSKEERQMFHDLLNKLTEVIWQEAEQPARPVLRLLPASRSEVTTQTPEFEGDRMAREQEMLRAVTRALLLVAEDAVTALSLLMSDVPSSELSDFPTWLASAQAIIRQAEALVPRLRLVK